MGKLPMRLPDSLTISKCKDPFREILSCSLVPPSAPITTDIIVMCHASDRVISVGSLKTGEFYTKDEVVRLPIQVVFIGVYANSVGLGCSL